nr:reverse transcriptase domain-containing protein [Tanacetum cinerariifolium]
MTRVRVSFKGVNRHRALKEDFIRPHILSACRLYSLSMSSSAQTLLLLILFSTLHLQMGKGKKQTSKNSDRPSSDAALREYCDKYYHQLLPIIAEKVHQEKVQQEKLKEVKARLNFEGCSGRNSRIQEVSQHSVSRTPNVRGEHRRGRRSESPRHRQIGKERRDGGVFNRPGAKKRMCPHIQKAVTRAPGPRKQNHSLRVKTVEEDTRNHFTHRIYYFDFPKKARMPNNVKTYDRSDDPEDHLKFFQAAAKVKRWAMPTWCHMFNSTLIGSARVWFDDLPPKSIDSYDDLKKEFLANFLQQNKCIKDPVEICHIKQREGESTEDFEQRFKAESRHVKGATECMRISGFMHGITNHELIKRMHDNIPKSVDEIMKRSERRRDKFTLLTKSPKEILALEKGKFKAPPPMTTLVEKINNDKLCEFHREVGHNTDECMHLRRQIEELINNGKLSHVIKELKQGSGKDQPKAAKKGETPGKDKSSGNLNSSTMAKGGQAKDYTKFFPRSRDFVPPLGEEDGKEGPMIIEAKIGGHFIHRIYVDEGSASEILYEHCFSRLRPEVKNQMVPVTAPPIGFSGEVIWPMGQMLLPVKIGDAGHSTSTWMNFVVVRSPSPYNGIIGRPGQDNST